MAASDLKTAQRVAAAIQKYNVNDEPVFINPDEAGADWANRQGPRPNSQVVHSVPAKPF